MLAVDKTLQNIDEKIAMKDLLEEADEKATADEDEGKVKLRKSTDTSVDNLTMSQSETMDICSDLCAVGTCPPGCHGYVQPPWGQGR